MYSICHINFKVYEKSYKKRRVLPNGEPKQPVEETDNTVAKTKAAHFQYALTIL